MWNELGAAPGPDEFEVTVMGPGYGESVVVHLGDGRWMVVDSCIDLDELGGMPAPLRYLFALGVDPSSAVELIVASHWDDDHVRGIARLLSECPNAVFSCPHALTQREFSDYVERLSTGARTTHGANVSEFRMVLELLAARAQVARYAAPARALLADPLVRTWSPSDYEHNLFLDFVARNLPSHSQSHRMAVPGSPNLTSTVITIEWAGASALLGGDMETHADDRRGWLAVASEAVRLNIRKCELVKIPHHGSHTGHDERMWSDLLIELPLAVIVPYGRGRLDHRPPKSTDVRRIRSLSGTVHQTARHTTGAKELSPAMRRALEVGLIRLNTDGIRMGLVRFRRRKDAPWHADTFGAAFRH